MNLNNRLMWTLLGIRVYKWYILLISLKEIEII